LAITGQSFRWEIKASATARALALTDERVNRRFIHLGQTGSNLRDVARDKKKASRPRYAQHALKPELVAAEMKAVRGALGSPAEVELFFRQTLTLAELPIRPSAKGGIEVGIQDTQTARALRQALQQDSPFTGRFDLPLEDGEIYLGPTSPVVEGLAGWVLDHALNPAALDAFSVASRCGLLRTRRVATRTTLLVTRFRYHLKPRISEDPTLLCEEIVTLAFQGPAQAPQWIEGDAAEALLSARPQAALGRLAPDASSKPTIASAKRSAPRWAIGIAHRLTVRGNGASGWVFGSSNPLFRGGIKDAFRVCHQC